MDEVILFQIFDHFSGRIMLIRVMEDFPVKSELTRIKTFIFLNFTQMATNPPTGDGHRHGAVRDRSQFEHPNGHWYKRDDNTGRIINCKSDENPFKGVRKEK